MVSSPLGRETTLGRPTAPLLGALLLATVAVSAVATAVDGLSTLILLALAAMAVAVAIRWPIVLFYVYCAAIPFNFALPPGPAGTIARIAGLAFFIGYLVRRPDSLRPGILPIVGWAFVAWTLASCLWAGDAETGFEVWLSLVQLFAITILVASIVADDPGTVRPALWAYSLAAAVTAAIGSISYLQSRTIYLDRAVAFSGQDPALFASLILPAVIFLMWELQSRGNRVPVRMAALGSLFVCVVGLALSGTRSGWIGIVAAAIAWVALGRERRQALSLAAGASAIVLLAMVVPGMSDFLLGRVESSLATGGAGRTDIWSVGLYMFASAPLTGVGLGNFPISYTPYVIDQASAGFTPLYVLSAGRAAHNVLLGTFVETGVVGGMLLIAFCGTALLEPSDARVANVIRAILVGFIVQSLFLDILGQKQVWLFLAIAFGLGAARRAAVSMAQKVSSPGAGDVVASWPDARVRAEPDVGRTLPTPP